jgi:hypothetical protein
MNNFVVHLGRLVAWLAGTSVSLCLQVKELIVSVLHETAENAAHKVETSTVLSLQARPLGKNPPQFSCEDAGSGLVHSLGGIDCGWRQSACLRVTRWTVCRKVWPCCKDS